LLDASGVIEVFIVIDAAPTSGLSEHPTASPA
jgi:hypothetical protein